ncbi:claudin-3-like protein [Cricetulus griseus]|uniref:Claudin-3-like protein n=2 Tax=Cricetulus griseus TaxID=10029 RepID=A0A061HUM5_CRIGR|nr:claudin-3-like protein [Cricetulus griseus]
MSVPSCNGEYENKTLMYIKQLFHHCQVFIVTVIMVSRRGGRQLGGFAAATLAWIFCSVSMNLPQWRVWCFEEPMESKPSLTLVGMWRTCVYHRENNSEFLRVCYQYTYQDTFIPLNIRVAQHLLLISSILGLIATISVIVALWKLYTGRLRKKITHNPFFVPGILNIIASVLVFISTLYNYLSIIRKDGIAFPPYFHIPNIPDNQKVGTALAMATLSSFLFLVGGTISISFTLPERSRPQSSI